jgi:3-deoxy-D-manno-octulosonic-acid transferase
MSYVLNVLYLLLLLSVSPWIAWQSWHRGRYRRGWKEKFFGPPADASSASDTVWLHAVSVGEVQVLRTLVEQLAFHRPDLRIVITVTTDSGIDLARRLFHKYDVFFTPFDFTWAMRRAFRIWNPKLIILAELELWPNWLKAAERFGCPVAVFNGRLSERSMRGYARLGWLVKPCLQSIDWIGAQSETYASRFKELGAHPDRVTVTGNTKFDGASGDRGCPEVLKLKRFLLISSEDVVWVAGSTQAPEEELVLKTYLKLSTEFPNLKLLLVPRHAERFSEVAKQIETMKLPWARRSTSIDSVSRPDWKIFLGDSVGELRWWWGLADIGFVGGSFGDRGGQNMIEPCAYGVATCFGPNTKNFTDIVRLLREGKACEQLPCEEDLFVWIRSMAASPELRQSLGRAAMELCQKHRGATLRTWHALEPFLPQQPKVSE